MSSLRRSSRTRINIRPVNRRIELEDQLRKLQRTIKGLELSIEPAVSEQHRIETILDSTNMQSLYTRTQLADFRRLYTKSQSKEALLNSELRLLRTQLYRLQTELMRVIHEENTRNGATQAGKRRKPRHTRNTRKKRRRN